MLNYKNKMTKDKDLITTFEKNVDKSEKSLINSFKYSLFNIKHLFLSNMVEYIWIFIFAFLFSPIILLMFGTIFSAFEIALNPAFSLIPPFAFFIFAIHYETQKSKNNLIDVLFDQINISNLKLDKKIIIKIKSTEFADNKIVVRLFRYLLKNKKVITFISNNPYLSITLLRYFRYEDRFIFEDFIKIRNLLISENKKTLLNMFDKCYQDNYMEEDLKNYIKEGLTYQIKKEAQIYIKEHGAPKSVYYHFFDSKEFVKPDSKKIENNKKEYNLNLNTTKINSVYI